MTRDQAELLGSLSIHRMLALAAGEAPSGPTPEREYSDTQSARFGGLVFPLDAVTHRVRRAGDVQVRAGLDSKTATTGAELKFVHGGTLVEELRPHARIFELGALDMTAQPGALKFPRLDSGGTPVWIDENAGVENPDSEPTLGSIASQPKTLLISFSITRQLIRQSGVPYVDELTRGALARAIWAAVEEKAIAGDGTNNTPTGLLNTAGIGSVAIGTNGGAPAWEHLLDLEQAIAVTDADVSPLAYLTTPGVRRRLKVTPRISAGGDSLCWDADRVNGAVGAVTRHVPSTLTKGTSVGNCHAIIAGAFSQLIIVRWGNIEILVDPYRQKKRGMIDFTAFLQCAVVVRHPQSFAVIKDCVV